ncbi:MAG: class I SAM-dependent rRNA methyltransferase [Acidimicrobiia bacterium]|nr:class I SAM-dependent rRNA methyltransferase [Acidimicrobiia bacterium]
MAVVSARGERRIQSGHPWVYRSDVVEARAEGGETVVVLGPRRRVLGQALFSDRSQITLRMLTRGERPADDALWRNRLEAAIRFRASLDPDATAYRLVHGEGDLLPSLIVDRYGEYLVVQLLSQGVDRRTGAIVALLVDLLAPAGILARNDPRVRLLEGLDQHVRVLHGTVPDSVVVSDGTLEYDVDLHKGQKTGLFLDQRENRVAAAGYARGRALDAFSYHGGFALRLAGACDEVEALDISAEAAVRIGANAARNGIANVRAREVNVFDELRRLEKAGERYDTIVLDPPAFAKNKAAVEAALAGYKEINLRAMRLLRPGGVLVTCSCSYNVDEPTFQAVLDHAAADAGVTVAVLEKRMQARDHPVLVGVPESHYLKCFILRRVE